VASRKDDNGIGAGTASTQHRSKRLTTMNSGGDDEAAKVNCGNGSVESV